MEIELPERYADFCAEIRTRLIDANTETLFVSRRVEYDGIAELAWSYSDLGRGEPVYERAENPEEIQKAAEALPGTVSYEAALALCSKAIETGEVEIVSGGFTKARRKPRSRGRRKANKGPVKPKQTVVVAFVNEGRLYCGMACVAGTEGTSLLRPFGTNKAAPDIKATLSQSARCFSVELV